MFQGKNDINLVILGSEIPEWFSCRSVGASVNPQVPSYLRNKKLMGIYVLFLYFTDNIQKNQLTITAFNFSLMAKRLTLANIFAKNLVRLNLITFF